MSDIEADKTRQLMASIDYASLIQRSHLVESDRVLASHLADHGLLWEPRDVVGGDAYFFRATPQGLLGCVFDCTGHGVPGAFMTLIALSFLEQAVHTAGSPDAAIDPGALLGQMNRYIKRVLQQRNRDAQPAWGAPAAAEGLPAEKTSSDGLDAALFLQSPCGTQLRFASARLDLLVAPPGVQEAAQVQIHAGDKMGIGYATTPDDAAWNTQVLEVAPGSLLMIATDGVIDQLGGPRQIAHGRKRLARFLHEQQDQPAAQACAEFQQAFAQWQGTQRRRDDVSLLVWRNQPMAPSAGQEGQA
jgi:serine phosphatase RsbU (regulator of sigma subunit)